jgi:hypothetical protein
MGKFALFVGFIFTSPMVQPNIDILGGFILSHHHEPIHSIISSMIKFLRTYIGSHNFNSYIYILLQLVFIHFFGIMQVNKSSPRVLSQNYNNILLYTMCQIFWLNERCLLKYRKTIMVLLLLIFFSEEEVSKDSIISLVRIQFCGVRFMKDVGAEDDS